MHILAISGSSRPESSNIRLLKAFDRLSPEHQIVIYNDIHKLPLFRPEKDAYPWPQEVILWRESVKRADAIIISTPEYLHNIPAALKNALEWLSSSGEVMTKRVLPVTFTPHPPRGEKAMQSLIWSLNALKANVVTRLPLYLPEVKFDKDDNIVNEDIREILYEAIHLLIS